MIISKNVVYTFFNKSLRADVIEIDIRESDGNEVSTFAMIKNINKNDVQLDLNHPLAGIEIKFKVKIICIHKLWICFIVSNSSIIIFSGKLSFAVSN